MMPLFSYLSTKNAPTANGARQPQPGQPVLPQNVQFTNMPTAQLKSLTAAAFPGAPATIIPPNIVQAAQQTLKRDAPAVLSSSLLEKQIAQIPRTVQQQSPGQAPDPKANIFAALGYPRLPQVQMPFMGQMFQQIPQQNFGMSSMMPYFVNPGQNIRF